VPRLAQPPQNLVLTRWEHEDVVASLPCLDEAVRPQPLAHRGRCRHRPADTERQQLSRRTCSVSTLTGGSRWNPSCPERFPSMSCCAYRGRLGSYW